jgi:hypothetical protein
MLSAKLYAPTSAGEITKVSRLAVRIPSVAPPNLPATAQILPESKRRFSDEPLKRPPKTGDSKRGRSSVTFYPSFCEYYRPTLMMSPSFRTSEALGADLSYH